jgi:calcium-dependent protein kinase
MPPFWGDTEKEIFQRISQGYVDFETAPWPSISAEAKGGTRTRIHC